MSQHESVEGGHGCLVLLMVLYYCVHLLCEVFLPEDDYPRSPRVTSSKAPRLDEDTVTGDSSCSIKDP